VFTTTDYCRYRVCFCISIIRTAGAIFARTIVNTIVLCYHTVRMQCMQVMQGLLVVLAFLLSFGFKTFLFFTVLWYVLSQESLIERMVRDLLPISPDKKTDAVRTLRQVSTHISLILYSDIVCIVYVQYMYAVQHSHRVREAMLISV
jgi:predicted PurR-regulated permease PerM